MNGSGMLRFAAFAALLAMSCAELHGFDEFSPSISKKQVVVCNIDSICFAIDESGSINRQEYKLERKFIINITEQISSISPGTSYSAYAFASISALIQSGTKDLSGTFIPTLEARNRMMGGTNLGAGLNACFKEIKRDPGPVKVIVLLSDGKGKESGQANDIKSAGIGIVTIGIGPNVAASQMSTIATAPEFYIPAENFDTLQSKVLNVIQGACTVALPSPDATPSPEPMEIVHSPEVTLTPEPVNTACQAAFEDCDLMFQRGSGLQNFRIGCLKARKAFTPFVVKKTMTYGHHWSIPLRIEDTVPLARAILDDGKVISFGRLGKPKTIYDPFMASKRKRFSLRIGRINHEQMSYLFGHCIKLTFIDQCGRRHCIVFKVRK